MSFRFRLQSLLDLREREERTALAAMDRALRAHHAERAKRHEIEAHLTRLSADVSAAAPKLDRRALRRILSEIELWQRSRDGQLAVELAAERALIATKEAYRQAMLLRMQLEHLRRRKLREFEEQQALREARELDETNMRRAHTTLSQMPHMRRKIRE